MSQSSSGAFILFLSLTLYFTNDWNRYGNNGETYPGKMVQTSVEHLIAILLCSRVIEIL